MKILFWIFCSMGIVVLSRASTSKCNDKWPICGERIENIVCERKGNCTHENGCEDIAPDPNLLKLILQEHNRLRNYIASGNETRGITGTAANMMALSYDKALEYTAKCNVNMCKFQHDKCRGTAKFTNAGQNIYSTTSKDDLKNAVLSWYNEIKNMTDGIVNKFAKGRSGFGNFTQLIWAKTTHVGCAMASSSKTQVFYLTCNYGPAGNVIGEPIYERGPGCSKCPLGTKCNSVYPSLCGDVNDTEINGDRYKDEIYDNESTITTTKIVTNTDVLVNGSTFFTTKSNESFGNRRAVAGGKEMLFNKSGVDGNTSFTTKSNDSFGNRRAVAGGKEMLFNKSGVDGNTSFTTKSNESFGNRRAIAGGKEMLFNKSDVDGNTSFTTKSNESFGNRQAVADSKKILFNEGDVGAMSKKSTVNSGDVIMDTRDGMTTVNFINDKDLTTGNSINKKGDIIRKQFNISNIDEGNRTLVNGSYLFDSELDKQRNRKSSSGIANVTSVKFLLSFCLPILSYWSVM